MKFLHLSDLHIGKSVNGFSMLSEQKHVFKQVIGYVKTEQPAAVVIAGDVYDRAIPGVEAVRVFDDFLTELANEDVAVLLISGNHDSPERMNYASRLLSDKRIFFYGAFDGSVHKVVLPDEYGEVNFWLMPFIKPTMVRGMFAEIDIDNYDALIKAALESAGINHVARNVLVSHQFYTKAGVTPTRSESELSPVGGLDAVDAGIIELFDYVALGHLHGSQGVGAEHIRYCGSPIKYSFSECRHEKSMALVEMGNKGDLSVKYLPLIPLHDMREIKGEINQLMSDEVLKLANQNDYLRVILTDEDETIDPMGKLRSVYPNIMSLDFENSRTSIDVSLISSDSETIEKLSVYELFGEFFIQKIGYSMSEDQAKIVREILERSDEK
ncbi:MAG: exonuclease SbcCD subunit D [Clostridiales bacterium]|jgi:exonuclease SbcD|nr:exonuclease SbcCD subunit D [Clostridiales bacterium]